MNLFESLNNNLTVLTKHMSQENILKLMYTGKILWCTIAVNILISFKLLLAFYTL